MARSANVRGRQVVKFYTTGKRFAEQFGLPSYVRGIVGRYDDAKRAAVKDVSDAAVPLAIKLITDTYSIPESELDARVRTANTPDAFRLFASSLRFPLSLFNGQWNGRSSPGATAEIVRGHRKTYQHAFMAPGRFRGRTMMLIYARIDGKKVRMRHGRYSGQLRQPTQVLRGPSTYQMIVGGDQSGKKWVVLAEPLGTALRDRFVAAVKSYVAERADG